MSTESTTHVGETNPKSLDAAAAPRFGKTVEYFPSLDGLRVVCCTFVVMSHGFYLHPWATYMHGLGRMGVNVFFSLSGFLITNLLLEECERTGKIDLRSFYMRRALRIFPVYFAALGLACLLLVGLGDRFAKPFGVSVSEIDMRELVLTHTFFIANWFKQPLPVSLEVLWSISVEEQFYLMFPLALALNRRAKWPAVLPVAIGLVIAWTSRAWLARTTPTVIYRSTFANGDHLLLGALLAQVGRSSSDIWRAFARTGLAGETGALASVLLVAAIVPTTPLVWFLFVLASSLSTTALVGVLVHGERWLGRLLSVGYVRRLGQMTYAGYVFHEYPLGVAAFCLAKLTSNKLIAAPVRTAVALPLVFAVAYLARVLIEQRAAKIRERLAV